MTQLHLSVVEPFTSPVWESNFVVFSGEDVVPEEDSKEYIRKVCKYAKNFGVYLVPQRFTLMDYQCMCLITPEGKVQGAQKGLFLNTATARHDGKHGSEMEIFHTEFGGIYLSVDVDIYHPETARIAAGMGAQYIICAQTIQEEDYGSSMVFTGSWNAAQSGRVYVVNVSNLYACVCAPLELTKHRDGFISPPGRKIPLSASLEAGALESCPPPFRLSRKLYALHRKDMMS